jgi:hypothetical protein
VSLAGHSPLEGLRTPFSQVTTKAGKPLDILRQDYGRRLRLSTVNHNTASTKLNWERHPSLCHPERSREPALSEVEWGSAVLRAHPGNVFRGSGLGFEARRACPELVEGADRQTSAQPGRAGDRDSPNIVPAPWARHTLTSTCISTLSRNISRTGLQNRRPPFDFTQGRLSAPLRRKTFPRKVRGTADPSAALRRTSRANSLKSMRDFGVMFMRFGGPQAHATTRDDNFSWALASLTTIRIVIPTRAKRSGGTCC